MPPRVEANGTTPIGHAGLPNRWGRVLSGSLLRAEFEAMNWGLSYKNAADLKDGATNGNAAGHGRVPAVFVLRARPLRALQSCGQVSVELGSLLIAHGN